MKNLISSIVWYAPVEKLSTVYILEWIIFPIVAPFFTNLPFEHAKLAVLLAVSIIVFCIVSYRISRGIWKKGDLGFEPGNIKRYWPVYALATFGGIIWLRSLGYADLSNWKEISLETFFSIPLSDPSYKSSSIAAIL